MNGRVHRDPALEGFGETVHSSATQSLFERIYEHRRRAGRLDDNEQRKEVGQKAADAKVARRDEMIRSPEAAEHLAQQVVEH